MKTRLALVALVAFVLLALPSAAFAQLAPNEVYANTTFKLGANHDGLNTTEYRLYRDNALVSTVPMTALVSGVVTIGSAGLPVGTYVFQIAAKGDLGEAKSIGLSVVVKVVPVAPNAPTGLRIVP